MKRAASALVAVLALAGCGGHLSATGNSHATGYTDTTGWSVTVPAGMQVEQSHSTGLHVTASEATFASFRPDVGIKQYERGDEAGFTWGEPRDSDGHFPADAVAFRMFLEEGGPATVEQPLDTHFPIGLADFRPSTDFPDDQPPPLEYAITVGGRTFRAYAWIGPQASAESRADLGRLVESLAATDAGRR